MIVLSPLAGAALVIGAGPTLHARAKPPVSWIATIDVRDHAAYAKAFAPVVGKIFAAHGGAYVARRGTGLEG